MGMVDMHEEHNTLKESPRPPNILHIPLMCPPPLEGSPRGGCQSSTIVIGRPALQIIKYRRARYITDAYGRSSEIIAITSSIPSGQLHWLGRDRRADSCRSHWSET